MATASVPETTVRQISNKAAASITASPRARDRFQKAGPGAVIENGTNRATSAFQSVARLLPPRSRPRPTWVRRR